MIEVDADDPAFGDPTKFVGPIYDDADAEALAAEKGWAFKRDGEHLRRVVPVAGAASASSRSGPIRWLLEHGRRSSSAPAAAGSRRRGCRARSARSAGSRR